MSILRSICCALSLVWVYKCLCRETKPHFLFRLEILDMTKDDIINALVNELESLVNEQRNNEEDPSQLEDEEVLKNFSFLVPIGKYF